jgi:signal peptidase I
MSMEPAYSNGSVLITEPVRPDQLTPGMVVVIDMDTGPIVKRIAYMAGDKIPQVLVATEWEDVINVHVPLKRVFKKMKTRYFTVPPNSVYFLGDNRHFSLDSRELGCVSVDRINRRLCDQRPFDMGWHAPNPGQS